MDGHRPVVPHSHYQARGCFLKIVAMPRPVRLRVAVVVRIVVCSICGTQVQAIQNIVRHYLGRFRRVHRVRRVPACRRMHRGPAMGQIATGYATVDITRVGTPVLMRVPDIIPRRATMNVILAQTLNRQTVLIPDLHHQMRARTHAMVAII